MSDQPTPRAAKRWRWKRLTWVALLLVLGFGYSDWETIVAGKKRGMVCTIELASGQRIRIVPVHLSHRSEAIRVASAKTLMQLSSNSKIPLLLAGDFNSSPSGFPHSETTGEGANALDDLLQSKTMTTRPLENPILGQFTFPADAQSGDSRSQVIDWIMVPEGWPIRDYRVIDSQLSDHRPVVAEVELPVLSAIGERQP